MKKVQPNVEIPKPPTPKKNSPIKPLTKQQPSPKPSPKPISQSKSSEGI